MIAEAVSREISGQIARYDIVDVDAWFDRNRAGIHRMVTAGWHSSSNLAGLYLSSHAISAGTRTSVHRASLNQERLETSMRVTGPITYKQRRANGLTADMAKRSMIYALAGAAHRLVFAGSRDTIMHTVAESRAILGHRRRSATGNPCSFCAMIIARGAVYTQQTSNFRVHDHDRCVPEPVYRPDEPEPAETQRFAQLWNESTSGIRGERATQRAFRRAYESL